ncbi:MAG: Rne/Rng family ribonuclease [Pseudomonadales bacterium]|jgi:ribonuclease G|nr:Rne/Rng family ribonuclease [Pseudomonadales bacterium]
MTQDVLVNVEPFETRVALLEQGGLQELHLARADGVSATGNVYSGRVVRILPGMQAAFVDVGLERPGFLHARDIRGSHWPAVEAARAEGVASPPIERLLSEGDRVLVQVVKDPISSKGARLTTHLALPSRFLVLMPFSRHVGVSQRIDDEVERERLRGLVERSREQLAAPDGFGYIVRTVADGAQEAEIAEDMAFLNRTWERIEPCRHAVQAPALVYEELPVQVRVLRDLVGPEVASIRIDCADTHAAMRRYAERFLPELSERLHLHEEDTPLFERHAVDGEIARALTPHVPLKCGGHLVIEQTEAMTTIDVNTGGFVGARSLEDTVYRANLEAAAAIPRQLRLRNLGGIVVIDFIDMEDAEHQRNVLRTLEKAAEHDPARIRISGISNLGLVELSRKRTRESLTRQLCEPCGACEGRGYTRRPESVCFEIFRALQRDARRRKTAVDGSSDGARSAYLVRAGQAVLDRLLDEDADEVAALSERVQRPIRFQLEPSYSVEQFDVVLLQDLD